MWRYWMRSAKRLLISISSPSGRFRPLKENLSASNTPDQTSLLLAMVSLAFLSFLSNNRLSSFSGYSIGIYTLTSFNMSFRFKPCISQSNSNNLRSPKLLPSPLSPPIKVTAGFSATISILSDVKIDFSNSITPKLTFLLFLFI